MTIVFFSFYYPPDLCAGSFRAIALAQSLGAKIAQDDELHIITTHPNRYSSHRVEADDIEVNGNITVHRIAVPVHRSGMLSQARTFGVFALQALKLCEELKPVFLMGTTSRLMTGVLTWVSAHRSKCSYFIDLRDIFSETISGLFARKSRLLGWGVRALFLSIEKRVFKGAAGVNVVSVGFPAYFDLQGVDTSNWSFFSNGVDQEFLVEADSSNAKQQSVKVVLYAGNIGSGQGLETIIPAIARQLGDRYRFVVVGDGGTRSLLQEAIDREGSDNVQLLSPVGRDELVAYYQQADILFLHLNDVPAFHRVLPSKIFEYAALGKPIVAGLQGYSAQFLRDNVPYACLFDPGDVEAAANCITGAAQREIPSEVVSEFVETYSRSSIMDKMADHLIGVMGLRADSMKG